MYANDRMGLVCLHIYAGLVEKKLLDMLASVMHVVWMLYDPDFTLKDLPKVQVYMNKDTKPYRPS